MAQVAEIVPLARPFSRMADEELVARSRRGCTWAIEFLLGRYRGLVEGKARAYFLAGADHEDVVQEGMIGLFKAIRDFSSENLCAFRSFAELCVTRQIISAVKTSTRRKHAALNQYVSTDLPEAEEQAEARLAELLQGAASQDPQALLSDQELEGVLRRHIGLDLSRLEAQALLRHLDGESYHEIAADLGRQVKQIDNALQRAKRKLSRSVRASLS